MTTDFSSPHRAASRLTHILDAFGDTHGGRFPVDVVSLAHEVGRLFQWLDPITEVKAAAIPGFEGALFPNEERSAWMLLYNNQLRSPGRVRFTQAHELGHYLLHRAGRDAFQCTDGDMLDWDQDEKNIELEADIFASHLLMPANDFREQVSGRVDLDLFSHCADRYGVSLTAAILKWLEFTEEKAVLVMSREGFMNWSWSSKSARKAGAFFKTKAKPVPIPDGSLAADGTIAHDRAGSPVSGRVWFRHADRAMVLREMKLYSEHYDSLLTLLILPSIADVWAPWPREEM
ncbi:MAG: ImmA/IrrE family metallo-endopeptidase [Pseudomonadota bacterium]